MTKLAVEHMFTGTTQAYSAGYDSTKTLLGQLIQQKTGVTGQDKYVGPAPISMARPMEASTPIPGVYPHVIDVGNGIHWVFLADNATAAATRRVVLYTYDTLTQTWGWRGFITMTYPAATNHTIRGLRVARHLYTTGTVAVSGTAVTGSSTAWNTARFAVGARIGFGSTDPNSITTWYHISAIGSDTGITLSGSAGTISAGTAFVIEELRVYTTTTNATAANGGLFVCKGVNFDDFGSAGTTISAAVSTDNLKACYWLADASTVLNTASGGMGFGDSPTNTNHDIYVINADSGTSLRIYKYNGRAALTVASGKSTNAFVYRTGAQSVTGTLSQTNACRLCTASHGPGSGVPSIYTVTTTRVIRIPEASITDANTTFIADTMVEIPPGSVNTFAATGALTSIEYAGQIDRFYITTGSAQRHYVTSYQTASNPFDRAIFCDSKQIDQSAADAGLTPYPSTQSAGFSVWSEGGIAYFARVGTTAIINQIYSVPLAADWDFAAGTNDATQNRVITPELSTIGCSRFFRVSALHESWLGSSSLGVPVEPHRLYYRTSGISDDSGTWNLVDDTGDLTGVGSADSIQFMIEFRMMGLTCVPPRIFGVICTYEDDTTDSHYQPSVANSSVASKRFAWRFSTAFGGTVPTLTIKLYDATSGVLLLTDTTAASALGTWEKSTNDGSSWGAYNTTDKANDTTYIRYTPTSIADNIKVRALLTQ